MILKLIIAIIIFYYLVFILWYRKDLKDVKPINKIISKRKISIIGKSTYILNTPLGADQSIPEYYAEPMQVDFEMEYDDDEDLFVDLELEEIELLTNEEVKSAQGFSFEEMSLAVEVIQLKQATEEIERQAAQTIALMQQTALYEIMIEQLDGGRQRVAEMLGKYEMGLVYDNSDNESEKELKDFDLG